MCVMSAIYDQFSPLIPKPWQQQQQQQSTYPWGLSQAALTGPATVQLSPEQLQQLIDAFREAVAAAKKADDAVGASNCVDPEKQKLDKRVSELEHELAELRAAKPKRRGKHAAPLTAEQITSPLNLSAKSKRRVKAAAERAS